MTIENKANGVSIEAVSNNLDELSMNMALKICSVVVVVVVVPVVSPKKLIVRKRRSPTVIVALTCNMSLSSNTTMLFLFEVIVK